ncbi:MAG: hypothetical protein GY861_27185 [bacterium]|nr:hypothetical protein [bacterium]
MRMMNVLFLSLTAVFSHFSYAEEPERIQDVVYCKNVGDKLGSYQNATEVYEESLKKAVYKAAKLLFGKEVKELRSDLVSNDDLYGALVDFIHYEKYSIKAKNNDAFYPCVTLHNAHAYRKDINRFDKLIVSIICNYNVDVLDRHVDEIKQTFVNALTLQDTYNGNLTDMLYIHPQIEGKNIRLLHYLYEADVFPAKIIDGGGCKQLYIYPIELYVESKS